MLQSKAGYIDARPHIRQLDEILLQRTAGPYIWVISVREIRGSQRRMSGFTPKADSLTRLSRYAHYRTRIGKPLEPFAAR
jgi:hypothetical protein